MKKTSRARVLSNLIITIILMIPMMVCVEEHIPEESPSGITIYYGLNESHSKSWARINRQGVVGISYFQPIDFGEEQGTLIYKTIETDGSSYNQQVATGNRLEKSVLLFDSLSAPHIFVASSDNDDQVINHHFRNQSGLWQQETIIHFYNEGGKFIYELSADTGPEYSFHILILKTRSDIDSDDFDHAWMNAHLYHLTNASGSWQKELIRNYDMVYTYDMYVKTLTRQDIKVDKAGFVHVAFGEQINGQDFENSPSRLFYATNKNGNWIFETALSNTDPRDDAGWYPSLCLNRAGIPYISCMYVKRVPTGSAAYCKLLLINRRGENNWRTEIIAEYDDGYYGTDGRKYTGALSHLVFDDQDTPHIVFSDVASSHWQYNQLNLGNIRYAVLKNDVWEIATVYSQPLPSSFAEATEMHGMCLLISEETGKKRVIGQELIVLGENQYSCDLVNVSWASDNP